MTPHDRTATLDLIEREAREHGIPPGDFLRFAYIETGGTFDSRASRGSGGAKGLFQFTPGTARDYGIAGREFDPKANADAAARLYLHNRDNLVRRHEHDRRPHLSGEAQPRGVDLYLAHQQGGAGYASIQNAIATGRFSRSDTRGNVLNNVSASDVERVTGVDMDAFRRMSDGDMAKTFARYWDRKFDRISIPEKGIQPENIGHAPAPDRDAARPSHSNIELEQAYRLTLANDGVRYRLGSKSTASGAIDCSGWVVTLQNATMDEINHKAGRSVFRPEDKFSLGMDAAATIVQKASLRSGALLQGAQVNAAALRAGMVIGEDNGATSFDHGRFKGIDHIVMVVQDPSSKQLMVSQSRGGEGVEMIPLDQYLDRKQSREVRLYATDPLHAARMLIRGETASLTNGSRSVSPTHSVTATDERAPQRPMQSGDRGSAITTLQRRLFDLDYRRPNGKPLDIDGDFGTDTLFALKHFQREHGLQGKGVAGPKTEAALERAERTLISSPAHPHHALYAQTLDKVREAEKARGIAVGPHSERIAAALTVECIRKGIGQVDRVEINNEKTLVRGVHDRPGNAESGLGNTDMISLPRASSQSMMESSRQCHEAAIDASARSAATLQQHRQPATHAMVH
jgi:hypothetical protein